MKLFPNSYLICLILFIDVVKGFDYCEIQFPKSENPLSKKIDLYTNNENQKFTNINSYIPGKTYDITVSLNNRMKNDQITIKELYVLIDKVQSGIEELTEHVWKDGGEILFNVSYASKTEYCTQRGYVSYLYTQPQHVTFYWTAPNKSGLCIRIIVIVKLNNLNLEEKYHTICNHMKREMQSDQTEFYNCKPEKTPRQPKQCNIMSTAVYRMTIENKWNSLNHWKDWPGKDGYSPMLTQYLGASHSTNFNLYHLGGFASRGVIDVCGNGSYKYLQQQLYKASNNILTIIQARSLEASSKVNKRSALVVVNATYHLVSFLSRLEPSPDWCTGLSGYDLCDGKCAWPEKVVVFLYPWDAGIFTGETYLYKKEIHNQSSICPITTYWPKDNPFTVLDGKLQNIGTVTFKLIQEYNKQSNQFCNSDNIVLQDEAYSNESKLNSPKYEFLKSNPVKARHCSTTPWMEWSSCSKTCGKGVKVRHRKLNKEHSEKCAMVSLKDVENCYQKCTTYTSMETCSMRLWSPWSPCNATCSQIGTTYRERVFINEQEKQECMMYSDMKSVSTCRQAKERCNPQIVCKEYVNTGDLCIWSVPSKRFYYDFASGTCFSFLFKGCYGGMNNFQSSEECIAFCQSELKDFSKNRLKSTPIFSANRCEMPVTWGIYCESEYPSARWSFDVIHKKCFKFRFYGCRGNANNFKTKHECESVCLNTNFTPTNSLTLELESKPETPCSYSMWSQWSACNEDCTKAQTRSRVVIEQNKNCNENVNEIRKCQSEICTSTKYKVESIKKCKYSNWSSWTSCSSQCGQGIRERKRKKLSFNCKPEFPQFTERESCYMACAFY